MSIECVDGAILVPPSLEGTRNDLALAAAQAHPERYAVMGKIDVKAPDSSERLSNWRSQAGMLGLRFNFKRSPQTLASGDADWVWGVAERAEVPVYVGVSHADLHTIDAIAERHPHLRLILDHMALASGVKDAAAFRDFDTLIAIAKRPNIAVKVSALPCYTEAAYPYRNLHPYVRRVYDAFGPRRMLWGSDLSPAQHLPRMRHSVHRGNAVALGRGSGVDHGARTVRMAAVDAADRRALPARGPRGVRVRAAIG